MKFRLEAGSGLEAAAVKATRPQLAQIGLAILEDARRMCPVDTGHLQSTSYMDHHALGWIRVGFAAHYAVYVSEGTSRQRPNPFFKSALYRKRDARRLMGRTR